MHLVSFAKVTSQSFGRSVLFVTASITFVALVFVPFALGQTGTNGFMGLASAAALCIVSAVFVEAIGSLQGRSGSHLVAMALSMAVRDIPLLAICLALAVAGESGDRHLGFVCYLLVLYFVALAVETWLAVERVNVGSQNAKLQTR